jgi:predicted lipid-binding transport protein (Tim44 family)
MMDENAKTQFKWKFYRLTVELNIIVLLVAMSILVFFLIHSTYIMLLIIGMLILAAVISLDFFRAYRETKIWLDKNAVKENKDMKESSQ